MVCNPAGAVSFTEREYHCYAASTSRRPAAERRSAHRAGASSYCGSGNDRSAQRHRASDDRVAACRTGTPRQPGATPALSRRAATTSQLRTDRRSFPRHLKRTPPGVFPGDREQPVAARARDLERVLTQGRPCAALRAHAVARSPREGRLRRVGDARDDGPEPRAERENLEEGPRNRGQTPVDFQPALGGGGAGPAGPGAAAPPPPPRAPRAGPPRRPSACCPPPRRRRTTARPLPHVPRPPQRTVRY